MKNHHRAELRFYEELNRFLPQDERKKTQIFCWKGDCRLWEALQAFSVPLDEIDLAIANDKSVSFNYHLKDGDRIALYPVFESLDISSIIRLRKKPLRKIAFILERRLDKLADYLEELGIEVSRYLSSEADEAEMIIRLCQKKNRIFLTQKKEIFYCNEITHAYLIRSQQPKWQLREVLRRFQLENILTSRKRQQQLYSR